MLKDEIQSWNNFGRTLMKPKREKFNEMMDAIANDDSADLDPQQAMILSLILEQQKIIAKLQDKIVELKEYSLQ